MRRIGAWPARAVQANLGAMHSLEGLRAIVTGAATGIGAATAERFEAEGAEVIGLDAATGYPGLVADVTDPGQLAAAIASAGPLDICVANAGVSLMEPFVDGTVESWRAVLDVNLIGVMTTFQAALSAMPRGGRLLATASTAGLRGEPLASAYCASKAGLLSVVKTLSIELAPRRINVNAVAPGQVETGMNRRDLELVATRAGQPAEHLLREQLDREVPARRLGSPEEVAAAFAFLAGPDAAYVSGIVLPVDGGLLSG
jgi:3-hydroxybutyrate dehydrogenase